MEVEKRWQDEVKNINRGLYIRWNKPLERWEIRHKDDRTGLDRGVILVEDEKGNYEDLNMGIVRHLKFGVQWDLVEQFKDPKATYLEMKRRHEEFKTQQRLERMGFVFDFNKEHKREWKAAIENAKRGFWSNPVKEDKKIFIDKGAK